MTVAKITASAPILLVRDLQASADYFRDKLGFSYETLWGDPPNFCIVKRDGHSVMLSKAPAGHTITPHWKIVDQMWNAYFWVDNVDALYEELQGRGAHIDYSLCTQPYNVREFGVQDLDQHDIAFGQGL
jgi:catechol 2,3-dioxygenase-like lactoylglutathione lyase family enzyme